MTGLPEFVALSAFTVYVLPFVPASAASQPDGGETDAMITKKRIMWAGLALGVAAAAGFTLAAGNVPKEG